MKKITPQNVLLDACVLYPMPVRDLLMSLAAKKVFYPLWSDQIHDEWTRNLLIKRPELNKQRILKSLAAMQELFPEADVRNYEHRVSSLNLPDPDDRHVLAAAVQAKTKLIITFNLKDFPSNYLSQFSIEAKHPDDFILELLSANQEKALAAFNAQVQRLKNPPMTVAEVLDSLRKCNLVKTAEKLAEILTVN